jgi:NAD(P)-dependent dehydrogenase (short-subunit alcohol dehydrogenase family)
VSDNGMERYFDLSGRVAVITGGNRGIGLGGARGLAAAGADVAIWARDKERNDRAVEELAGLPGRAIAIGCDVSDAAQVAAAAEETAARLGPATICLSAAGINRFTPFLDTSLDEFREVLATNLEGAFHTFQALVPGMIEAGGGSLIAVSSISARTGQPRSVHYAASKAGLLALTKSLAVELARHRIRANVIVPGWIETEMIAGFLESPKFVDAVLKRIPQRRWGRPDDLAGLVAFLAGDASSYITGAEMVVDGGYTLF